MTVQRKEIEKGLEAFVGQAKTLDQTLKDAKIKTVRDAVSRVVLKKGEVIMNEKENPETGEVEFDYNIE